MAANSPQSRSDWASLDWKEAQLAVADLLNKHGFVTLEEKRFENHKRADVIIKKDLGERVIIGVIEVKCYQKITRGLELSAMEQAVRYLKQQYGISKTNHRWRNKQIEFIVAVIYTKDYPVSFLHHTIDNYSKILPESLISSHKITLMSSTPNTFIDKLELISPVARQTKINDFFEK